MPSFNNFFRDLATGSQFGIFVDDSGSPGLDDTPQGLHPDRKTWVGVVIAPVDMREVLQQMPQALEYVQQEFGIHELHFADIYGSKKSWRGIDWEVRMGIFRFMVEIFTTYDFSIYVQTYDPDSLAKTREMLGEHFAIFKDIKYFNFDKPSDAALFKLLFVHLRDHVIRERSRIEERARVFIDEGFKPNGLCLCSNLFEDAFVDGQIFFASSTTVFPLQLADFAAFALNRTQLLIRRKVKNLRDVQLLNILSPLAPLYRNIEQRFFNVN